MSLSQSDREFLRELRQDFQRDLYETMDREALAGLNTNPYYGMTQREIDIERALDAGVEIEKRRDIDDY